MKCDILNYIYFYGTKYGFGLFIAWQAPHLWLSYAKFLKTVEETITKKDNWNGHNKCSAEAFLGDASSEKSLSNWKDKWSSLRAY